MKFSIGIETIPGRPYFDQTMTNLRRAGVFDSEHLAMLSVSDGTGLTRQQNGAMAIRHAVNGARAIGADWVVKLEDDLDFTDNFLENLACWLTEYGHAKVPMFTLGASFEFVSRSHFNEGEAEDIRQPGTSFPQARRLYQQGLRCVPVKVLGWWAAQALVWRTETAEQLVRWLGDDPYFDDGKAQHRNRGHDLLLQVWGRSLGAHHFAAALPAFVQHIGRSSNLDQPELNHKQPFFQFPWAGRNYEATAVDR